MALELDGAQPSQRLARYIGNWGVARLARGERQAAEATFERALAAAQAVWGEELLEARMDTSNWEWLEFCLWMLKGKLRESGPDAVDEALAVRCKYGWAPCLRSCRARSTTWQTRRWRSCGRPCAGPGAQARRRH